MCQLTVSETEHRMQQDAEKDFHAALWRDVQLAIEAAQHNHKAFLSAFSNLSRDEEANITLAVMRGDDREAGRMLAIALRREVAQTASQKAKDEIAEDFGVDLDWERAK